MKVTDRDLADDIVAEAMVLGVDPRVALAYAIAETNVRNIVSDRHLHRSPEYMAKVTARHPRWRQYSQARDWASYGPFALQALYHVSPGQHPSTLMNPAISAPKALANIAKLVAAYQGDSSEARIRYVCGQSDCSGQMREKILRRYRQARAVADRYLAGETVQAAGGGAALLLVAILAYALTRR